MEIRKSKINEINALMRIYSKARQFMSSNGNVNQWVNGYPSEEVIKNDILCGNSYLCIELGSIVGCFTFINEADPTYFEIYDGEWLNEEPYSVVHRIAVSKHNSGVASFCFDWSFNKYKNLRIDTHSDNIPMQKTLKKNGFKYCGLIYLSDGSERLAFQKTLK